MQCTDITGFRQAVASCLTTKPGQALGECPALAAAAQKYGAQCLDLALFQGGPPVAAYACGKNARVTAATQAVCNKLPNKQYHQTVVSGSGSSSGSGPDPGSGSSVGFVDSFTSAGRFGAWGDDNEGWQSTTSVGAGLGTVAQGVTAAAVIKGLHKFGPRVARRVGRTLGGKGAPTHGNVQVGGEWDGALDTPVLHEDGDGVEVRPDAQPFAGAFQVDGLGLEQPLPAGAGEAPKYSPRSKPTPLEKAKEQRRGLVGASAEVEPPVHQQNQGKSNLRTGPGQVELDHNAHDGGHHVRGV